MTRTLRYVLTPRDVSQRMSGRSFDPDTECVCVAGGLNGIFNTLLATVEPGQEVVLCDPIYAGLVNRVRLAGGVPRFVPAVPTVNGWSIDASRLAAAVGPQTAAVLMMGPAMPTASSWMTGTGPPSPRRASVTTRG